MGAERGGVAAAGGVLLAALVWLVPTACAAAGAPATYRSPDRAIVARILPAGPGSEFRLEIADRAGHTLATADHSSPDGEHGLVLAKAAWSADSQFFIFTADSAGGHQSWAASAYLFDRQRSRLASLGCFLPPVAEPEFTLRAPDLLTVSIWSPFTKGLPGSIVLPVTLHLRDLRAAPEQPVDPECAMKGRARAAVSVPIGPAVGLR